MLVNEAISIAQRLAGNAVDQSDMLRWLSELDGQIALEVYEASDWSPYTTDDLTDTELLVPYPYDKLYVPHLEAMIYYTRGEYDRYENSRAMRETFVGEFRRFVQRTKDCCGNMTIRRAYISAALRPVLIPYSAAAEDAFLAVEAARANGRQVFVTYRGEYPAGGVFIVGEYSLCLPLVHFYGAPGKGYRSMQYIYTFSGPASNGEDDGRIAKTFLKKTTSKGIPPAPGQTAPDVVTYTWGAITEESKLSLSGGTMSGEINMDSHRITALAAPENNTDAATKAYVDTALAALRAELGLT